MPVRSVLVVDDNPTIRKIICELFTREGDFEVCGQAENGREAIEKAQLLHPALIVTDLSMPLMNGIPESGSVVYVLDPYWLIRLLNKHPDRKDAIKRWKRYVRKHHGDFDEDDWERLYLPAEKDGRREDPSVEGQAAAAYFSGMLDEVSLYSTALTQNQIESIVNAGSAGKCQ